MERGGERDNFDFEFPPGADVRDPFLDRGNFYLCQELCKWAFGPEGIKSLQLIIYGSIEQQRGRREPHQYHMNDAMFMNNHYGTHCGLFCRNEEYNEDASDPEQSDDGEQVLPYRQVEYRDHELWELFNDYLRLVPSWLMETADVQHTADQDEED